MIMLLFAALLLAQSGRAVPGPEQLLGTWRGTSTCTDRVAAPACTDETVVYEFTPGQKHGAVRWAADKIVDGRREPMGEFELTYDAAEKCWKAEYSSPRVKSMWRVTVKGTHLTGTAQLLPGKQVIRKFDLQRSRSEPLSFRSRSRKGEPSRSGS
jgi:hypothetical protein